MLVGWLIFVGVSALMVAGYFIRDKGRQLMPSLFPVILSDQTHFIAKSRLGRRLVIPDVHGCSQTLQRLLEDKMNVTPQDQVFFLGDYIDKGKDSKGVLDYIIRLQLDGYQIYTLMGNHEQELMEVMEQAGSKEQILAYATKHKCLELLNNQHQLVARYTQFFAQLKYFYELDKYLLVHAGFNFEQANPFDDKEAMLWIRNWQPNLKFLRGKQVVQGHNPTMLSEIMQRIEDKSPRIKLDNGCVFLRELTSVEKGKLGHLLCVDLDTQKITMQQNIDR